MLCVTNKHEEIRKKACTWKIFMIHYQRQKIITCVDSEDGAAWQLIRKQKHTEEKQMCIRDRGVIDNAQALCSGLTKRGIRIVSGKTENHLMLVDLTNLGKTGKEAENLLDEVNITCNKNTIPNDPKSAFVTSGVRLGTAAVTSRAVSYTHLLTENLPGDTVVYPGHQEITTIAYEQRFNPYLS